MHRLIGASRPVIHIPLLPCANVSCAIAISGSPNATVVNGAVQTTSTLVCSLPGELISSMLFCWVLCWVTYWFTLISSFHRFISFLVWWTVSYKESLERNQPASQPARMFSLQQHFMLFYKPAKMGIILLQFSHQIAVLMPGVLAILKSRDP